MAACGTVFLSFKRPMKYLEKSITVGDQTLTLQFGKLARASHVAVMASMGETRVLVTLNIGRAPDDIDYLPLQVEYVEKLYAGGRIKGSRWVKREGRPTDEAILNGRIIDRGIRPLFPKELRKNIQIVTTVMSVDNVNSPEIVAAIGASAVTHLSQLPWNGPLSTIRVGYIGEGSKGEYVVNPTTAQQGESSLDLVVTSTAERVVMIETQARQVPEDVVLEGIVRAKQENARIIAFIEEIRAEIGHAKEELPVPLVDDSIITILKDKYSAQIAEIVKGQAEKESEDSSMMDGLVEQFSAAHADLEVDKKTLLKGIDTVAKKMMRARILKEKVRADGRAPDEIRPITIEVDSLPRMHGSAIFQRGDTQVMSITTLAAPGAEQLIEGPEGEEEKHYIHHYYFPPYSVGECGRIGFTSRREVGHGALAEKAVEPVLPARDVFPYTMRVVSEVLSSNGSTSMASTCGSILSLMAAGVPITHPVAGIAMGMISEGDDYVILTDLMGIEDFGGDMDFKVTGTEDGVTAIQLDVKSTGLSDAQIKQTLDQAKVARIAILGKMKAVIDKPREQLSKFAPKVVVVTVPQDKIGEIIGPGGRNIRAMIAEFGTTIDIDDSGAVTISGTDQAKVDAAVSSIRDMTRDVEVGEEYNGEVVRIMPFGAFVELIPGRDGLLHVSKMGRGFVKDPNDVVHEGQTVHVRVYEIDQQGRVNLEMIEGAGDQKSQKPQQEERD